MSLLNFLRKITPKSTISVYHFILAFLSALIYGFPSRKIKVIGVTGTDGKTTTVEMIHRIFEQAGYRVASFSSIRTKINGVEEKNLYKMTMPGRGVIQKFLKRAVKEKCHYALIEVTSEGVLQYRHRFIDFNTAVFTNLNPEHLERHGSFENYKKAKGEFFKSVKKNHIINIDDENAEYFASFPSKRKLFYGINSPANSVYDFNRHQAENLRAENINISEEGASFYFKKKKIKLNILGKFNIYNAMASICVAISQGISVDICAKALTKIKAIPGRMEIISKQPLIIVDYAHTPNALKSIYKTAVDLKKDASKLICVLGSAGGGRDKWKRKEMGKIADKYCDYFILTNEDPYSEDPEKILKDIEIGFLKISHNGEKQDEKLKYEKVLDRKQAIKKAINLAKPQDVVCITGKGCEPWMCVAGGEKVKWDDREIVREVLGL